MSARITSVGTQDNSKKWWNQLRRSRRQSADRLRQAVSGVHCEALESRMLLSVVGPFYVSTTTGSDTAAGTNPTTSPFLTIQRAIAAIGTSGNTGTIYVETGTYVLDSGPSTYNRGGLLMPSAGGVTLTNYQGGAVYIVGGQAVPNSWTNYSGDVWSTTLSSTGPLGYISNSPTNTYATVQEIIENFSASNPGSGTELTQYGTDGGYTDDQRFANTLTSNAPSNLPTPSNGVWNWYMATFSNTLYVNDGSPTTSPGASLTAASPHVLQDLYGQDVDGAKNDSISGLTFEISDATGLYNSTSTALTDFEHGAGGNGNTFNGAVDIGEGTNFENSNIYYAATVGLEVHATTTGTGDNQIIGDSDYYWGSTGILDEYATNFNVQYCDIEYGNTRDFNCQYFAAGIRLQRGGGDASTQIASYGTITESNFGYDNSTAIWSDTNDASAAHPIVISDNYIHNNILGPLTYSTAPSTPFLTGQSGGIKLETTAYAYVYNNVVTGNGPIGILLAGAEHCQVYNNNVSSNVGFAAIELNTDGAPGRTDVHLSNGNEYQSLDNDIENNIISHNQTTYDLDLQVLPSTDTDAQGQPWATGNTSDYNMFYRIGEPVQISYGDVDDVDSGDFGLDEAQQVALGNLQTSLAQWSALTASGSFTYSYVNSSNVFTTTTYSTGLSVGEDVHSIFADPLYASVTTTNWYYNQAVGPSSYVAGNYYLISTSSPAIDRGDPNVTGITNDYEQISRPTPPTGEGYDIGAFEHTTVTNYSTYKIPVLDGEAWVDDTLPQGAVVYGQGGNTHFFRYLNGGSWATANSTGVTEFDVPFMWEFSTGVTSPYAWGAGAEDGDVDGASASALEIPDFGQSSTTASIMSFQSATQTMTIGSTSDSLYFYVWEALPGGSPPTNAPTLSTPSQIGISYYDQTQGKWISAYSSLPSTSMTTGTNPILPDYSGHALTGTLTAGQWDKLSINAGGTGGLGMAAGDVISGLTLAALGGEAAFDNIGVTPADNPVAPTNVEVTAVSATTNTVSWTANSSNATGYIIQRAAVTAPTTWIPLTTTSALTYNDTTMTSGVGTYYYRVEAYHTVGTSTYDSSWGTAVNTAAAGNTGSNVVVSQQASGKTGLVGAWDFEDTQQGVLATDSSGNTNTATLTTGATLSSAGGVVGDDLALNGTSGYATVASNSTLAQSVSAMTLEAWVYVSPSGTVNYSGIDKQNSYGLLFLTSSSDAGAPSGVSSTNPAIEFYINNPTSTTDIAVSPTLSTMGLSTGTWMFIVGNWGGAQPKIWVDNLTQGSVSYSGTLSTNTNSFNIGLGEGSNHFNGSIDEVQLTMGYERDNTELTQDYNDGPGSGIHAAVTRGSGSATAGAPLMASTATFSNTTITDPSSDSGGNSVARKIGLTSASPFLSSP